MACRGLPTPPSSSLPSSSSSLPSSSSLSSEESSGTGSSSSSRPPLLLERLRASTLAAIARKWQTKTNPPPVGKRQCRGNFVSDPKSVEPSKRVREFPNEQLKVSGGKLFCSACHEELGLKRSTIQNHI